MKSFEVRNKFIEYFQKQGHAPIASSSLIPDNDPTLLFTNAGMNQFKNLFLGLEKKDYVRAVSSQKCVRAGGKHNDLENVGFTARHHTFFEMLGNFSFGDYFKKEAIHFAWELLTKELGIPKDKLYVTVFQNDDEAAEIWHKQEGIPRDRIFRFGEKDNFWRMGETGPCGPCTEIFYDHGPKAGPETDAFKGISSGGDRYVEIWNLVMMQFFEKSPGVMEPLPRPSVDTGSGLERVSAVMQGVINNYDTDLFLPLIHAALNQIPQNTELQDLVNHVYKKTPTAELNEQLAALRVMADHCRAISFLLADGAIPSNEGRGYVLRRILRRAIRYQKKLSEEISFLPPMIEALSREMGSFYPELLQRKAYILNVVQDEESRFSQTLQQGTLLLHDEMNQLKSKGVLKVSGSTAFKLYDTFGFPLDLTHLMAREKGFEVDENQFQVEMEKSRLRAKASWKGKGLQANETHLIQWCNEKSREHGITKFTGYETLVDTGTTLSISDGNKEVNQLATGQSGFLLTNRTPFYGESGGQAGDVGSGWTSSARFLVHNTTKQNEIFVHHIEVQEGNLKKSDSVTMQVHDSERRKTANNHSATHLLHAALRMLVGTHVTQAGSLVDSEKLRFDYTHNKPLTTEEILTLEKMVNEEIAHSLNVKCEIKNQKEALQDGAMALFGEKYGDQVRVVKMGGYSIELCGGTHVTNTSQIRLFKIVSEYGVSAGVRRIEALTGDGALQFLNKHYQENQSARFAVGVQESWTAFLESQLTPVSQWIDEKKSLIKSLEREIKNLQAQKIDLNSLVQKAVSFELNPQTKGQLLLADLPIEDKDVLTQITDQLKDKLGSHCVVVVVGQGPSNQPHPLIVSVSKDLTTAVKAGDLLKQLATLMGGKGGGRPDFAQGAAPHREKLKEGFKTIEMVLGVKH